MSDVPDPADTGLFGKLPRSRPGTRSPRRATAGAAQEASPAKAKPAASAQVAAKRRSAPRTEPAPPPREPRAPEREAPDTEAEERGAGLEELAWAGIAVTAEAATLGVRLMSRALDAARRATERG